MSMYDAKSQYQRMLKVIRNYEVGNIPLAKLVEDLEFLIRSLENASEDWQRELIDIWGRLEIVYAIAVDEKREYLTDVDRTEVGDTLEELKRALEKRLSDDCS